MTLHQMVQQWERQAVEEALRLCNHHRGHAARLLGLSRSSFFERLKAWGYSHEGEEARQALAPPWEAAGTEPAARWLLHADAEGLRTSP